ncbi:glycosyltransferase [Cupriavidus sp. 2MCAB6]|uniref:glycosyltransferase n=1 Tax=Cupriavidus sp. 2MCAB6 TaxID=3232981 RepID=UPI003F92C9C5
MNITIFAYDLREKSLAGSYRTRKFIRYFSESGVQVKVVCAFVDDGFKEYCADQGIEIVLISDVDHETRGFLDKIFVRAVAIPDIGARWVRKAMRNYRVIEIISNSEVVYLSSPPHGLQLAGPYITSKFNIPFVADFRDDFVTNHRINWRTPVHKKSAYRIERSVLREAAAVIVNTDIVKQRFASRHGDSAGKISCITNGFDSSDVASSREVVRAQENINKGSRRLIYSGSAYDGFAADAIGRIVASIDAAGMSKQWEIHTAGPGNWDCASTYENWVHHGLLSQEGAASLMRDADLLLLLMPPGEREPSGTVPLKAYSYLGSDRPIIYFGETGSTTELLKEFSGTFSFQRDFIDRIGFWLLENQEREFPMAVSRYPDVERYEFRVLSSSMKSIFESVVDGRMK